MEDAEAAELVSLFCSLLAPDTGAADEIAKLEGLCNSLEEFCKSDALSLDELQSRLAAIPPSFLAKSSFFCRVCANERVTLEMVQCILDVLPPGAANAMAKIEFYYHGIGIWRTSGVYPLHAACANEECPDAIIELLLEKGKALDHLCFALPHGVPSGEIMDYSDDVEGTPLHYYLARESNIEMDMVKTLVEACPEAVAGIYDDETGHNALHTHLCNPCFDLGIIRYLIEKEPQSAQWDCRRGELPLHFACANPNANSALVEFLLGLFPEAIHRRTSLGYLPIHELCKNTELIDSALLCIYNILVERDPGMLRETADNMDGELPIHFAVQGRSLEFCKVLLEAYPESAGIQTRSGALPFHDACAGRHLDTVQYLLELRPGDLFAATNDGRLPIHLAKDVGIITYLLLKDPDGVTRAAGADHDRGLPLHLAYICFSNGIDAVQVLFDSNPWAIAAEDSKGKTPVDRARDWARRPRHHRLKENAPELNAIGYLEYQLACFQMAQDNAVMATVDEKGQLPLHRALSTLGTTLGTVKLLVEGNPSALQVADRESALPLHLACSFCTFDVVQYLLELDSTCLYASDKHGDTILHCACRRGNLWVAAFLCGWQPFCTPLVYERNIANKLPFHLLCEVEGDVRQTPGYVDVLWRLLLAHPETVLD